MLQPKILPIDPNDHEVILNLYLATYQAMGEKRNKAEITPFVNYLLQRPFKLKIMLGEQIVGGFIADIKPRHTGNILFDPELFIMPDHQQKGLGKALLSHSLKLAQEKYGVESLQSFTFKDSYQLERYKRLGFEIDGSRAMLYADIATVLPALEKK